MTLREFMNITKVLADENRVRMLFALRGQDRCVCPITELLGRFGPEPPDGAGAPQNSQRSFATLRAEARSWVRHRAGLSNARKDCDELAVSRPRSS